MESKGNLTSMVSYEDSLIICKKSISKTSTQPTPITPLYSFEHADDYIYDVKWSPTHPALFGTVDGAGQFDLWNLNADTEEPFASTQVGSGKALNKLAWDKEGRKTAIGSSDGHVYVYDVGEVELYKMLYIHLLNFLYSWLILNKTIGVCYKRILLK